MQANARTASASCNDATRILLLSPVDPATAVGGRAMLGRTNLLLLRDLLGDRLIHLRPPHAASPMSGAWRGRVDGVDAALIDAIIRCIDAERITQMVVDGSNYGAAIRAVKRQRPRVRIVTFFHNVEARFFWGALRARPRVKPLAVLAANYIAERMAVRHSDVVITLSTRDGAGLRRLYGRGADTIAPIVLWDQSPAPIPSSTPGERHLMFVGGGFYANIAGIRWFARHVAPRLDVPVKVVGRGMEELAADFAKAPGMTLVGAVDDLAPFYAGAAVVIAPIFDGSGMKTKVAEALMHGKHVIGTPEAFSGYATDVVTANRICTDADDFVAEIKDALTDPPPAFDPAMRALFERDHAPAAARARLAGILGVDNG